MPSTLLCGACLSGLLLCALAVASARERSSADFRFVGTWELQSLVMRAASGAETNVWGTHPVGRLVYEPGGGMMVLLMHEDRNQANGRPIPEAVATEAAGYFGTYTVDRARAIVTHHIEVSLRASESGAAERSFEFRDGNLLLSARAVNEGSPVTYVLTWSRPKPGK